MSLKAALIFYVVLIESFCVYREEDAKRSTRVKGDIQ